MYNSPKEPPPPPPPEVPWSEEPSNVVHLTEEDFKPFLKRKKHVLLMFYAPCKNFNIYFNWLIKLIYVCVCVILPSMSTRNNKSIFQKWKNII